MREDLSNRLRFSTRTLLFITLVMAVIFGVWVSAHRAWRRTLGIGTIRSVEDWPRAFADLVGEEPELAADVRLYGLGSFLDHKSIWMIDGDSSLLAELIAVHANETTTNSHPIASELISSIPASWPRPNLRSCSWHVTPGYGQQHIEGVNLYLVLRDEQAGRAYVLHEWIF